MVWSLIGHVRSLTMLFAILLKSSFANCEMGCHEMFILAVFDKMFVGSTSQALQRLSIFSKWILLGVLAKIAIARGAAKASSETTAKLLALFLVE